MNINFSTKDAKEAERFLSHGAYSFFTNVAKEYILLNLGDLRVQDPSMYPEPRIEVCNNAREHKETILELCLSEKEQEF